MSLQFEKYIHHPIVQDRIRIYHIKKVLDKLVHIKNPSVDIKNNIIFVNKLTAEDKIAINRYKKSILDLANKKIFTLWLDRIESIRMS